MIIFYKKSFEDIKKKNSLYKNILGIIGIFYIY